MFWLVANRASLLPFCRPLSAGNPYKLLPYMPVPLQKEFVILFETTVFFYGSSFLLEQ
jgi:hypothetical protein